MANFLFDCPGETPGNSVAIDRVFFFNNHGQERIKLGILLY